MVEPKKNGGEQGGRRKKWVQRPNAAPTTGLGFTFDKRNEHGWKKKTQSIFWESSTKHINPSPGLVLHVDVQAHSRLLRFSSRTKLSHDKAQLSRPVPDNSATSPVHCQTEERHTFSASSRFFLSHFWHFQSLSLSLHVLPAPAPPRSPLPLHLSICVKFLKLNSCSCLLSLCRLSAKASVITPVCD